MIWTVTRHDRAQHYQPATVQTREQLSELLELTGPFLAAVIEPDDCPVTLTIEAQDDVN